MWKPYYVNYTTPNFRRGAGMPLWIPFLLIGSISGYLFYRDRRYPPGHCKKCGYDLQGNVSGVCPECGKSLDQGRMVRP